MSSSVVRACSGSSGELAEEANVRMYEREEIDNRIKALKYQSRGYSRRIGLERKAGRDATELIAQNAEISREIASLRVRLDAAAVAHSMPDSDGAASVNVETESDASVKSSTDLDSGYLQYIISTVPDSSWNKFVADHPHGTLYHSQGWARLIGHVFGKKTYYVQAVQGDGSLAGALPLTELKSRLFGHYLVSLPYVNYGGPVALNAEIAIQLMKKASELALDLGCTHIEYRAFRELPIDWPLKTDKVNMILPLPQDPEDLLSGFPAKLRAQIKRPQRENPVVRRGKLELLEEFYQVFARNMRDLGTPVYTRGFFQGILEAYPTQATLVVIRFHGRPVSAAFLLHNGETMEIPWASSLREYNRFGFNMLLYAECLKLSVDKGCRYFDFGRSSRGSGTFRFKQQWGAAPRQCYWYYWMPEGKKLPELNPNNPRFKIIVSIWKLLPVWLTRLVGPPIVRNLP